MPTSAISVLLQRDIQAFKEYTVAPRVGAWIETALVFNTFHALMSHPVWVRGLKLTTNEVAKYLGVSHPVWVRGLKL